jgi:hypothetical protein
MNILVRRSQKDTRLSFQYTVSILRVLILLFLCGYAKHRILYKEDSLSLTIYVCYLWEVALNNASIYNF